jgi:vesicle coat complex subunit
VFFAFSCGRARFKTSTTNYHQQQETMNPSRVRQYLNNPKEQEKAKGMKWLLAMISKGSPCHEFFPDVVKCVVCKQVRATTSSFYHHTLFAPTYFKL